MLLVPLDSSALSVLAFKNIVRLKREGDGRKIGNCGGMVYLVVH
jgi:hypothetical protein